MRLALWFLLVLVALIWILMSGIAFLCLQVPGVALRYVGIGLQLAGQRLRERAAELALWAELKAS